jgi:hypothetical protein
MFNDHTQEADFLFVEFALSGFQEEVVLSQNFRYLTSSLSERFSCLGIDKDIVHVDDAISLLFQVLEYLIHKGLEGCR